MLKPMLSIFILMNSMNYKYFSFTNFMMIILMIMSFTYNMNNIHPLIINILILTLVLLMTVLISSLKTNSWFSFMIFLIIVSGLMILFMYFMNFSINEYYSTSKFSFSTIFKLNWILILAMTINSIYKTNFNILNKTFMNLQDMLTSNNSINYFSSKLISYQPITLMIYLLIFLMIISFICNTKKNMIRQMI